MSTPKAANDLVPPLDATAASMAQSRRNVGWGFWLRWTLVTAVGWVIGIGIYFVCQFVITAVFASLLVGLLLVSLGTIVGGAFGGIMAAAFGFTQGFILKQYKYSIRRYTEASFIGGVIGGALSAVTIFAMAILLFAFASSQVGQLITLTFMGIAGAVTGATVGHKQKNLLKRQGLEINRWVLANTIGWAVGCTMSAILGQILYESFIWPLGKAAFLPALLVLAVICGLIGGAITGYPLMRALQQSPIQNPKSEIQNESSSSYLG